MHFYVHFQRASCISNVTLSIFLPYFSLNVIMTLQNFVNVKVAMSSYNFLTLLVLFSLYFTDVTRID